MRRRRFLALVPAVALAAPKLALAQAPPRIGVLIAQSPPHRFPQVFGEAMRELGYVDGQNVDLDVRYGDGLFARASAMAAELVQKNVAIIVAHHTPAVRAAMNATSTIPIVMAPAGAPLQTGLVKDLARPGGNVTGMSGMEAELGGKRLALLREIIPELRTVAVLGSRTDPFTRPFVQDIETAGQAAGIAIQPILVDGPSDFAGAFATMEGRGAQAVMVQPLFSPHTPAVVSLARQHRVAIVSSYRETTQAGGLLSFSGDQTAYFRRAAAFVDRILRGSRPADLPVEQPTKFELTVNLATAAGLALKVPPSLLAQADEVFE